MKGSAAAKKLPRSQTLWRSTEDGTRLSWFLVPGSYLVPNPRSSRCSGSSDVARQPARVDSISGSVD